MRKLLPLAFTLMLLPILNGCGTLFARSSEASSGERYVDYYKGTHGDLMLLGFRSAGSGSGNPHAVICWFTIVCPVLTVVSLPADLVIDTALLPVDVLVNQ